MNINKKTVFIACPYTNENRATVNVNVYRCMYASEEIWNSGFIPFFTLLTHFYEQKYFRHRYEDWMEYTMTWLSKCDIVLRLPGKSSGADREIELAKKLNKKIYYNVKELIENEK